MFLKGDLDLYADPLVHMLVDGKYDVLLGKGSQSAVIAFNHNVLQERRVLQVLLPDVPPDAKGRFLRGFRIVNAINNKEIKNGRIPPFYQVYELSESPAYAVVQHIQGCDLYDYLLGNPQLTIRERLVMFKHLALSLHLLHENNVIHRDLKPGNIIVDNTGFPRWIDFGIAISATENPLTQAEQGLGTPKYAAPEQLDDAANVDQRADIFALGKVLHTITTGSDESFDPGDLDFPLLSIVPKATNHIKERRYLTVLEFLEDVALAYSDQFDLQEVVQLQVASDDTIGTHFLDLLGLYGGNTGKVKQLLHLTMGEWEHFVCMSKEEVIRRNTVEIG